MHIYGVPFLRAAKWLLSGAEGPFFLFIKTSCMTRPSDGGREGRVRERGEGGEGGEMGEGRGILSLVTLCHPSSPVVPCRHPLPLVVTRCHPL